MIITPGVPGFEPGIAVPKTAALPLGYTPPVIKFTTSKNANLLHSQNDVIVYTDVNWYEMMSFVVRHF